MSDSVHDAGGLPEGFPFTIDELRTALGRSQPDSVTILVNDIVSEAHREVEIHNEIAQHRRHQGREPDSAPIRFHVSDKILAHLMFASASAAERVRAIKQQHWAETREREIDLERRRAAERAGLILSLDDILDDAERRGDFSWDDSRVFHGMAVSGSLVPEPPPATAEVIAVAESYVAEDIAAWEELVEEARGGAPFQWQPNGIGDLDATMPEDELPDREPSWEFIDEYIEHYDRYQRGYRRLWASIERDLTRFNSELVRSLRVAPARAIPRVITYHLIGGYNSPISIASPVGTAFSAATAGNTPAVTTKTQRLRWYETANLLDWYEMNRERYEPYPFFDEWRARKRTRREVSFMRLVRDRPDEAFPPPE